jgi:hypothetical protein
VDDAGRVAPALEVQIVSEGRTRKRSPSAKNLTTIEMLPLTSKFARILTVRFLGKKLKRSMMPDLSGRNGSG